MKAICFVRCAALFTAFCLRPLDSVTCNCHETRIASNNFLLTLKYLVLQKLKNHLCTKVEASIPTVCDYNTQKKGFSFGDDGGWE